MRGFSASSFVLSLFCSSVKSIKSSNSGLPSIVQTEAVSSFSALGGVVDSPDLGGLQLGCSCTDTSCFLFSFFFSSSGIGFGFWEGGGGTGGNWSSAYTVLTDSAGEGGGEGGG